MLTVALVLFGVGWNFRLISGTALVVDSAPLATRARTQGGRRCTHRHRRCVRWGALGDGRRRVDPVPLAGGFLAVLLLPAVRWYRAGRPLPA
jgi:hypothetical protein